MDSLTHIAIGACIGDLFLGKKIGKKAMLYGAIAASLPDMDFIASFWLSPASDLLAHRGITHSLLFAVGVVAFLGFYFRKKHAVEKIPVKTWLIFMGVSIGSHLFLDSFNAYGIGLFEPFFHSRISWNTVFVADPFFSFWPGLAALFLLLAKKSNTRRKIWARAGLTACSLYLLYCMANKLSTDSHIRYTLAHQGIHYNRYFTTPTPFNNWLWYAVAETDSGYFVGYRSVFDEPGPVPFHYFPKNDSLLRPFSGMPELRKLILFSQGYYTVETTNQGVVFNDLRFGQMMGWENPAGGFVFHFYLQRPEENRLVVQRGRFSHWNRASIGFFIKRIRGK